MWKGLLSSCGPGGEERWDLPQSQHLQAGLHHRTLLFLAQRQPWMISVPWRLMWTTPRWTVAEACEHRATWWHQHHHFPYLIP